MIHQSKKTFVRTFSSFLRVINENLRMEKSRSNAILYRYRLDFLALAVPLTQLNQIKSTWKRLYYIFVRGYIVFLLNAKYLSYFTV